MRVLEFKVDKQHIKQDPNCDFTKIVAGSKNYLKAHYTFSDDWAGYRKAVSFWRGKEEHAVILKDDACMIPEEVLVGRTFMVSVLGMKNGVTLPTNKVLVIQEVLR